MGFINKLKQHRIVLGWAGLVILCVAVMVYFWEPWASPEIITTLPSNNNLVVNKREDITQVTTTGYRFDPVGIPATDVAAASNALFNKLPYHGQGFRIIFDFKENKFIVYPVPVDNAGYKQQFLEWLKTSEYSAIPLSSFGF